MRTEEQTEIECVRKAIGTLISARLTTYQRLASDVGFTKNTDVEAIRSFALKDSMPTKNPSIYPALRSYFSKIAHEKGFNNVCDYIEGKNKIEKKDIAENGISFSKSFENGAEYFLTRVDNLTEKKKCERYVGRYILYRLSVSIPGNVFRSLFRIYFREDRELAFTEMWQRGHESYCTAGLAYFIQNSLILVGTESDSALLRTYVFPSTPARINYHIDGMGLLMAPEPVATRVVLRRPRSPIGKSFLESSTGPCAPTLLAPDEIELANRFSSQSDHPGLLRLTGL